jgi:hypothetical protein
VDKETPISIDDLRVFLSVRLAVAPRRWFHSLWKPNTPATDRDDARRDLVNFITEGWERFEIKTVEKSVFGPAKGDRL